MNCCRWCTLFCYLIDYILTPTPTQPDCYYFPTTERYAAFTVVTDIYPILPLDRLVVGACVDLLPLTLRNMIWRLTAPLQPARCWRYPFAPT